MERDILVCPSFVKLLMEDDFAKEIRIPNAFMRDFKNKLARKCVLTGTTAKKSWPVRICRKENNFFICKRAWPNFVKDHKLKYGDYLLFWLVKKTTFVVIPYGADCSRKCVASTSLDHVEVDSLDEEDDDDDEDTVDDDDDLDPSKGQSSKKANHKELKVCSGRSNNEIPMYKQLTTGIRVKEENEKEREERFDARDGYYETNSKNPFFVMEFKPSHKKMMTIPYQFGKEIKLETKQMFSLHGKDDRKWLVKIWANRTKRRFGIGEGWSRFCKGYQVKVGDTCKFTFMKSLGNVFCVEVMRPW